MDLKVQPGYPHSYQQTDIFQFYKIIKFFCNNDFKLIGEMEEDWRKGWKTNRMEMKKNTFEG